MNRRLEELADRFGRMEKALEELKTNGTRVTIETVHIHQPQLEKLEYRLDRLDIQQLSGSLNMGNNFGAKFQPASSPPPFQRTRPDAAASSGDSRQTGGPRSDAPSPPSADAAKPGLERTETGYRVRHT
ncbi:hypothetical protein J31TS4_14520 [Paenibacillus sp. J31TS4]|uniref:spore germination protein GerPC n=1 Tax=Paenibacillus sp. J31TS4 TaxID=2807195 RepID=UPI001B18203C|nr:spore germination protein GerPC [Paenibacillus sp. J31TS4]GIP38172.1 hypothetical protein J31TS4_14520 [Paenibacillus sp. J31TS4]